MKERYVILSLVVFGVILFVFLYFIVPRVWGDQQCQKKYGISYHSQSLNNIYVCVGKDGGMRVL